jgi:hypothetical protein
MKKLAFLALALIVGSTVAIAVKASKPAAVAYCHCEPDRVCNSTGAWGIKVQICP